MGRVYSIGSSLSCFVSIDHKRKHSQAASRRVTPAIEIYDLNQNCNTYGKKEVNNKGISPRQGIYAKLKRVASFRLDFLCTRGVDLLKHHQLNEF